MTRKIVKFPDITWRAAACLSLAVASAPFGTAGPIPSPTHVAQAVAGSTSVPGGSFENRNITTFLYTRSFQGWELGPDSGVVREGNAFAIGHDFTSFGVGLFLQRGNSFAQRTFSADRGAWQVSFEGGQRFRGGSYERQIVQILVDGVEVFEEQLQGGSLRRYLSQPFWHGGGDITIRLSGRRNNDDHTAVIDDIRLERVGRWNEATAWVGGSVPSAGNHNVHIPAGVSIALDAGRNNLLAGHIHLEGELGVIRHPGGTTLAASSILVDGTAARFQVGTALVPHETPFTLGLNGTNRSFDIEGFGNKFLGARAGGLISLHGKPVTNYVDLDRTANRNATEITTRTEVTGWEVGDKIAISTTNGRIGSVDGHDQNEVRTITAIQALSNGRARITLDSGLSFRHVSQSFTTRDNVAPRRTWNYEVRSRAALFDRSIRIVGNAPGSRGFGGHVMVMGAINGDRQPGVSLIENVHFLQMGQRSLIGRYPFHWHMLASEGRGQYLRNCSIEDSFNRAITIHGTHNTQVVGNFAYRHLGHGLFLEDGAEEGNTINENMVMLSEKPRQGEEILQTDNGFATLQNSTPSAFWISNPSNTMDRNIAAGTEGVGYWFIFNDGPTGLAASDPRLRNITPRTNSLTSFKDNIVHSSDLGFDVNDSVNPSNLRLNTNEPWQPSTPQFLDGLIASANKLGIYTGLGTEENEVIFTNTQLIDNVSATMFASYHTMMDSLIASFPSGGLVSGERNVLRMYDGPARLLNCHFHNFNASNTTLFRYTPGAVDRSNWMMEASSFDPAGPPRIDVANTTNTANMDAIIDVDGTVGGVTGTTIVTTHPILRLPSDPAPPSNWRNAFLTRNEFSALLINFPGTPVNRVPRIRITRRDQVNGAAVNVTTNPNDSNATFLPIMNNDRYRYDVTYPEGRPSGGRMNFIFRDCFNGDSVIFRFPGLASVNGRSLNVRLVSSLSALESSNSSAYAVVNNDVYFKFVRAAGRIEIQTPVQVVWD